jgi:hypothetical protein
MDEDNLELSGMGTFIEMDEPEEVEIEPDED